MGFKFNPPPGWHVEPGFNPGPGWVPDPAWPAAPDGWQFWIPDSPPPPPPAAAAGPADGGGATAKSVPPPVTAASKKVSGLFRSLKSKAEQEDWTGKAKTAANQAVSAAQQATGQATAAAKQRDQATLEHSGPLPEGALWRGVSHEAGRNSIVTLYPDRIERTKPTSKFSLTGMLTGGPEDVEVIPTKSISSVQARRGSWYHDVTIYASGNTIILSLDAAEAEKLRGLVMEQVLRGSSHAPAPAAPAAGDALIDQIRKLGELRDAGLITNEEFEAKKLEMLGRI
jgi:hypothetical protein